MIIHAPPKSAIPQAGARGKMTERNEPCTVQVIVKAYRRYKLSLTCHCNRNAAGGAQVAHPPTRYKKSISYAFVYGDTFLIAVKWGAKK
jgi:hypothetical protein